MTVTSDKAHTRREAGGADCTPGVRRAPSVRERGWRDRIRTKPGLAQAWRIGVFLVGMLFVALGVALTVLPGPLTIPPVLLGLWIWSTEFDWAHRFFITFEKKAKAAWAHAKRHPSSSTLITLGGLAAATAAFWVVSHYELVARSKQYLGL